jgi:hypothetical protein
MLSPVDWLSFSDIPKLSRSGNMWKPHDKWRLGHGWAAIAVAKFAKPLTTAVYPQKRSFGKLLTEKHTS